MAKAFVKDNVLFVEVPFKLDGKKTASRKNVIHATTEPGTIDALTINVSGHKVIIQLNAYSAYVAQVAPVAK